METKIPKIILLAFFIILAAFAFAGTSYDLATTTAHDLNIIGATANSYTGYTMTFGDADADGFEDDLVISAWYETSNGRSNNGSIYLILNAGSYNGTIDLASSSAVSLKIEGEAAGDWLGKGESVFADADCDGFKDDLMIFAPGYNSYGMAYLFNDIGMETGTIDLANTDKVDLKIRGYNGDEIGQYSGAFGDVDHDGCEDDLVIGLQGLSYTYSDEGAITLIKDLSTRTGTLNAKNDANFFVRGGGTNNYLGYGPVQITDMHGDGFKDDVIVGSYQYCDGGYNSGLVLIENIGSETGTSNNISSGYDPDLWICGNNMRDRSHESPKLVDLDGDGKVNDLFMGIKEADNLGRTDNGIIYLIKNIDLETSTIYLSNAAGKAKTDFNIIGAVSYDYLGNGELLVQDFNSDGKIDLFFSAYGLDPDGRSSAGAAYIIYDVESKVGTSIDMLNPGSNIDVNFLGPVDNALVSRMFGPAISDADSDGQADDLFFAGDAATVLGRSAAGIMWYFDLFEGAGNIAPSINITNIDGNPDHLGLPSFSYAVDGNLSIDFNVQDLNAGDTLTVDLNFSSSRTGGTIIVDNLILDATVCDDANFEDSTACSYDFNIHSSIVTTDGNYYIVASISDGTVSSTGSSNLSFNIDGTSPTYGNVLPSANLEGNTDSYTFAVQLIDSGSGPKSCNYGVFFNGSLDSNNSTDVNAGNWCNATVNSMTDNGVYYVQFTNASDQKDNNSTEIQNTFTYTYIANATPDVNIVNIDSNPDNAALPVFAYTQDGNLSIDFNVQDTDATDTLLADINYSSTNTQGTGTVIVNDLNLALANCVDSNFQDSTSCSYDFNIHSSLVSDGNYYILLSVTDGTASDFNASDNTFMVDNTTPQVTADYNNSWQASDANITFTCTDNGAGCGTIYYRLDSDATSTVSYGAWTALSSLDGNLLFTADGNFALDFNAVDNTGHYDDTNTIYVLIDQVAPVVSISSPSNGSTTNSTTVTVEFTATNNGDLNNCWLRMDGNAWIDVNLETTYQFTDLNYDDHNALAVCSTQTDLNSNTASSVFTVAQNTTQRSVCTGPSCVWQWPEKETEEDTTDDDSNDETETEEEKTEIILNEKITKKTDVEIVVEDLNKESKPAKDLISGKQLKIEKKVTVKKVTSGTKTSYTAKFEITVKNNTGAKARDIELIEVIPKSIAESASQIKSPFEFIVLKDDPVIQFVIDELNQNESTKFYYTINSNITEDALNEITEPIIAGFTEETIQIVDLCLNKTCNDNDPCTKDVCYSGNGNCIFIKLPDCGSEETTPITKEEQNLLLPAIFVVVAVIGGLIYYYTKSKKPQNKFTFKE